MIDAADILEDAGFHPLEAQSVDEAEQLLEEYHGEIVLLFTDVQMYASVTGLRWAG